MFLQANARPELRPEAGAQRTLEAVSSRPLFGQGCGMDVVRKYAVSPGYSKHIHPTPNFHHIATLVSEFIHLVVILWQSVWHRVLEE
jgi:hypothetical protein